MVPSQSLHLRAILAGPLWLILCAPGAPTMGAQTPDFARDVYPILRRSCFECHGPGRQEGELRLDTDAALLKGGASGAVITPGRPNQSELVRRIRLPRAHADVMPARGATLTKRQVQVIEDWIRQGANWGSSPGDQLHWAYQRPARAQPPIANEEWVARSIDSFVLEQIRNFGIVPSVAAQRHTLSRRLSLDLLGVPPAPEQVRATVSDFRPDAWDRQVDRLLGAPQFGERWARPWLDAARYADSHGFQRDDLREVWPYRDWVIAALNQDMPFSQFVIEQLAGDLLPGATESQKIATGFHRCTTINVEAGSDPEESRVNQVIDRVNTTAAVFLGTTLECAQCHDHKYDPFSQDDYYRLFAFFNSTAIEADRANPNVPGSIRFMGPKMSLNGSDSQAVRQELTESVSKIERDLAARKLDLTAELERREADLQTKLQSSSQEHPLELLSFESQGGASYRVLDDRSILLTDEVPDTDTYVIDFQTQLKGITAFKLEALTDPSLPGLGPGRQDERRPNFVLNSFTASCLSREGERSADLRFASARADFSQAKYDSAGAIDEDPATAWAIAPRFHESHWAIFTLADPTSASDGAKLRFTLVQSFGSGRTIGRLRISAITGDVAGESIPSDVASVLTTPVQQRTEAQITSLLDFLALSDPACRQMNARLAAQRRALQGVPETTTLVMEESPTPRDTRIFARGDFRSPGRLVSPGTPAVLHPIAEPASNRLSLANWLVNRNNPLVARVTVNRWWAEIFGRGIVATVEDFGAKGEAPTHPEVLDMLAVEFMDQGWSMKRVLREIVLSSTYQQSSAVSEPALAADPINERLARATRLRLDAETIRDHALASAGLLSYKQAGPPIRPPQPDGLWTKIGGDRVDYVVSANEDKFRRGIYVVWKRTSPYPSFMNFDATARMACKLHRSRANTPLQALTLLNDPVFVEAANHLAVRIIRETRDQDLDTAIDQAWMICLARPPSSTERSTLRKLLEDEIAARRADPRKQTPLPAGIELPADLPPDMFHAWQAVATVLLNLDESITKE